MFKPFLVPFSLNERGSVWGFFCRLSFFSTSEADFHITMHWLHGVRLRVASVKRTRSPFCIEFCANYGTSRTRVSKLLEWIFLHPNRYEMTASSRPQMPCPRGMGTELWRVNCEMMTIWGRDHVARGCMSKEIWRRIKIACSGPESLLLAACRIFQFNINSDIYDKGYT